MNWLGDFLGWLGLALVAVAAGAVWGWPAACFAIGAPLAGFYLWGEAQRMKKRPRGGE